MDRIAYDSFDSDFEKFKESLLDTGYSSIRFSISAYAPEDQLVVWFSPKTFDRIISHQNTKREQNEAHE